MTGVDSRKEEYKSFKKQREEEFEQRLQVGGGCLWPTHVHF